MDHASTSRPALAWTALAAAYFLAATLSHEPVSNVYLWLAGLLGPGTAAALQDGLALAALLAGAWLALGPGRRSGAVTPREALAWLALAAGLAAADLLLIVAPVERVHYPQYALLALLLRRVLADEALVLGLATLAGMADELRQYVLHPGNTSYLDFNDFALNLLGALAGLLLARAFGIRALAGPAVAARVRAATLLLVALLAGGIFLAWAQGRILSLAPPGLSLTPAPAGEALTVFPEVEGKTRFVLAFLRPSGFWNTAGSGRSHHVLAPAEGLALLALLFVAGARLLTWAGKTKAGEPTGSPAKKSRG